MRREGERRENGEREMRGKIGKRVSPERWDWRGGPKRLAREDFQRCVSTEVMPEK